MDKIDRFEKDCKVRVAKAVKLPEPISRQKLPIHGKADFGGEMTACISPESFKSFQRVIKTILICLESSPKLL